jgi:hypothetical protein
MSTMKRAVPLFLLALLLVLVAYFIRKNSAGNGDADSQPVEASSSRQEALFRACVAARDREIHSRTFSTIDNPDVQREILATEKERAIRDCHEQYPDL